MFIRVAKSNVSKILITWENHIFITNIYLIYFKVIYQLLLDWERNTDGEKTVGYLTTLLWNCGHRECVHRLKPVWKSLIKNGTTKLY